MKMCWMSGLSMLHREPAVTKSPLAVFQRTHKHWQSLCVSPGITLAKTLQHRVRTPLSSTSDSKKWITMALYTMVTWYCSTYSKNILLEPEGPQVQAQIHSHFQHFQHRKPGGFFSFKHQEVSPYPENSAPSGWHECAHCLCPRLITPVITCSPKIQSAPTETPKSREVLLLTYVL